MAEGINAAEVTAGPWFRRRDNGAVIQCSTAIALWGEIRRDYSAMPVPRS